jgi:signal transduction histidine kinase
VVNQLRRVLEREAELRAYAVLDSESIPALERIADLAAAITGMAVAEVNVVTTTDVVHVATTNRDHLRVPREHSFCSTIIERDSATAVVPDATAELPFANSPYVTGEKAAIRSYASARLVSPAGTPLGTICVFDSERRSVTEPTLALLADLAGMVMDVLEMRRNERDLAGALARLAGSHRELNVSNESLGAFAGQISHDLQSPLAAVQMALELFEDEVGELGGSARQLLDHARSGGVRMQRTITHLLDYAVAGAAVPIVAVDLDAVLSHALDDLAPVLHGATVEVSPLPKVLGRESEVRSVVQNLVANAAKFSAPTGPAHVTVSGERREDQVRVVVADNGPGVPQEQRDAVFGLNVRGTSEVEGHGIGLATCARIIRALGGDIGVDTAPSGGAAFWFELPAVG